MILSYYQIILALFITFLACHSHYQTSSQQQTLIENHWRKYPERIRYLVRALDLEPEKLDAVKDHLIRGDTVGACEALLIHFENAKRDWVVAAIDPISAKDALRIAKIFRADSVSIGGVVDKIPDRQMGGWKWDYLGPNADAEFAYSLNAQSYLPTLYVAWKESHDPKYVEVFNRIINDWVIQHPLPRPGDSIYQVLNQVGTLDYRDIGEVEWRTLDTGRRLGASWPQSFYAFQHHEAFSPVTRLLMLSSLVEQANYLWLYHKSGHNWTTMEMNGLALAGLAFPEFKQAQDWVSYAQTVMSDEIDGRFIRMAYRRSFPQRLNGLH